MLWVFSDGKDPAARAVIFTCSLSVADIEAIELGLAEYVIMSCPAGAAVASPFALRSRDAILRVMLLSWFSSSAFFSFVIKSLCCC